MVFDLMISQQKKKICDINLRMKKKIINNSMLYFKNKK